MTALGDLLWRMAADPPAHYRPHPALRSLARPARLLYPTAAKWRDRRDR